MKYKKHPFSKNHNSTDQKKEKKVFKQTMRYNEYKRNNNKIITNNK